jgi:hypothetical protein
MLYSRVFVGLPGVHRANTLVRMGCADKEGNPTRAGRLRTAFLGSFLTAAELPPGLWRIRSPDTGLGPPALGPPPLCQGHAIWLGSPDAELYRLDDARWLLSTPRRAAALAGELLEVQAAPLGTGGASPPPPWPQVVRGAPADGFQQVIQRGPVVARLRVVPGEDAALPDGLTADLGRLATRRIEALADAAATLRRPGWRRGRWIPRPGP